MTALTAFAWVAACGSAPLRSEASDARAARAQHGEVRAPVDPVTSIPPASDVGEANEGATTLRPPLARDAVVGVVRRFFSAFVAKNLMLLDSDLEESIAILSGEASSWYPRASYVVELGYRVRMLPYDQLDVDQIFHADEIQVFSASELGRAGRPPRPASMNPGDVLVRVRVVTPKVGVELLFEDEVLLILGRDGGRYRIRGVSNVVPG